MIWAAVVMEVLRLDWMDLAVLLLLQFLNGILGWYEERNAGIAIEALKQQLAPKACVKRDGEWRVIDAKTLVIGDRIKMKLGDIIPADSKLGPGFLEVDQSVLTGESLAVTKYEGEEVYQGAVVKRGDLEAIVLATGQWTFFGKTSRLVTNVTQIGNFQKALFTVAMVLLCVSTLLVLIILFVVLARNDDFLETLSVCVVLEVASIPIAMQVVGTCAMAVGAQALATRKAIVTRLSSIEDLAGMDVLCCDKTGTLTKNELTCQKPRLIGKTTIKDIFETAALAAKREGGNQDAIDKCITDISISLYKISFDHFEELDFVPFSSKTKRTEAHIRNTITGECFKCVKGAPQVILAMARDPFIEEEVSKAVDELAAGGYRTLGVARTDKDGKWEMQGLIPLYDPPRDDTAETIQKARIMNINVKMITGDQISISKETARVLNLGEKIYNSEMLNYNASAGQKQQLDCAIEGADGFAEVFPEHKFAIVQILQEKGRRVGMTGDGVNDTPALKKADIGIAVEGATDAARAAADIVLTAPGLSVVIEAIYGSRKVFQRMKNYVIYRVACTTQLLIFFFAAMTCVDPQSYLCSGFDDCGDVPDTFTLPVIAIVIIALLNDGTILSLAYDNVTVSRTPEKWKLTEYLAVALVLGGVSFVSSCTLLLLGLNNLHQADPSLFFSAFGISTFSYGELLTVVWLKVSISDYLTLWAARTNGLFWTRKPGKLLLCAFLGAVTVSTFFSRYWFLTFTADKEYIPDMKRLHWDVILFVWIFSLICFILQEMSKLLVYWAFESYKSFQSSEPRPSGECLTDSFLQFSTGYAVKRTIVTKRSMAAADH